MIIFFRTLVWDLLCWGKPGPRFARPRRAGISLRSRGEGDNFGFFCSTRDFVNQELGAGTRLYICMARYRCAPGPVIGKVRRGRILYIEEATGTCYTGRRSLRLEFYGNFRIIV